MSSFIMPIEHELWLKTDGKEGQQFDLTNGDFSGKDLSNSMMIDVIFNGANMSNVDLYGSNLNYSSFRGANLKNSVIVKAEADHANFEMADLNNVNAFRTTFVGTNFKGAILTRVNFSRSLLDDADFTDATISGCKFFEADLSRVKGLDSIILDWIDVGSAENPKKIYGYEGVTWLQEASKK